MKYTVVRLFLLIYCRLYLHSSRVPGNPSFTATEATLASRHLLREGPCFSTTNCLETQGHKVSLGSKSEKKMVPGVPTIILPISAP